MYYQVQKHCPSTRNVDGTPIIQRHCGHKHRSHEAAESCRQRLLAYNKSSNTWSAAWHNSQIFRIDAAP